VYGEEKKLFCTGLTRAEGTTSPTNEPTKKGPSYGVKYSALVMRSHVTPYTEFLQTARYIIFLYMNIYLPDKNPVQVLATDGELKGETDC
jgi:hypothetical protein